jgi:RNA polymerase sigma-70 factor, ECF subfamily
MSAPDCPETPRPASDPQQQTSFTLLERLRANEGDAWRIMVQLYTPLVHHWCVKSGVRGADAEDVAQEVLRAAASHMSDFRRDRPGDSFRAWLRGITRNMVLQHFRRGGRHPQAAGGTDAQRRLQAVADQGAVDPPEEEDPVEELDALRRRALELVRGEFEERTWQMFWRVTVDGHSTRDVAAELRISPDAVRMAKSRVLRRLRQELAELGEEN